MPANEIDLNFVRHHKAAQQVRAGPAHLLRHREQGGNVIARMRIIRGEKSIVHVEFTHGHAVGPGGPLAVENALSLGRPENGCAA